MPVNPCRRNLQIEGAILGENMANSIWRFFKVPEYGDHESRFVARLTYSMAVGMIVLSLIFLMAALIYTLIGQYLLSILFRRSPDAVILRVFTRIASPILRAVRVITPAIVPNGLITVFAIGWLMAARMFWFMICVAAGMRPMVGE